MSTITDESLKPPSKSYSRDWLIQMKNSVKSAKDLKNLSKEKANEIERVSNTYHMAITPYYLSLCDLENDNDPIRKQCIPDIKELDKSEHEKEDPLSEVKDSPVRCLVHRYPDRVLLIVTNKCAMYCRHCTRKRIWKKNVLESSFEEICQAIDYVKQHNKIREVIVSGGDPFLLPTAYLDKILSMLYDIPHIEAIRIGTRIPVVMPQRVDNELCDMLGKYSNLWINTQFNHPKEVTPESTIACRKLQQRGIPISNQSVLLKGINDSPEVFKELCQKLQKIRVRPYYLFQCDAVVGAEHFRTSIWKGVEIIEKMRGHTSGMCVPTFVIDGEDGKGKVPIQPQYMISMTPDKVVLRNFNNETFDYYNPIN